MKYPRLATEVSSTSTKLALTGNPAELYSASSMLMLILISLSAYSFAEPGPPPYWQEDVNRVDLYYASDHNTGEMDNEYLNSFSLDINKSSNISQRLINYQWLHDQDGSADNYENNRAFAKVMQQFIKFYWQDIKNSHFQGNSLVPDGDGHGTFKNGLDYRLGVTNNKLELNFSHRF